MYLFVLDQLKTLQDRLLEVVTGVEFRAEARTGARKSSGNGVGGRDEEGGWNKTGWGWVPGRWGTRTEIAVQWLPVRSKALELMRQREALGNRVLFAQLAMIGSRLADQEERASMQEQRIQELLDIIKSFDGDDVVHL